jgi:hypothetical protein
MHVQQWQLQSCACAYLYFHAMVSIKNWNWSFIILKDHAYTHDVSEHPSVGATDGWTWTSTSSTVRVQSIEGRLYTKSATVVQETGPRRGEVQFGRENKIVTCSSSLDSTYMHLSLCILFSYSMHILRLISAFFPGIMMCILLEYVNIKDLAKALNFDIDAYGAASTFIHTAYALGLKIETCLLWYERMIPYCMQLAGYIFMHIWCIVLHI